MYGVGVQWVDRSAFSEAYSGLMRCRRVYISISACAARRVDATARARRRASLGAMACNKTGAVAVLRCDELLHQAPRRAAPRRAAACGVIGHR